MARNGKGYDGEFAELIGARLRVARRQLGLTSEDAAAKIGTSAQSYSAYETGRRLVPLHVLVAAAKVYKKSVGWLLGEHPSTSADNHPYQHSGRPGSVVKRGPLAAIPPVEIQDLLFAGGRR